MLLVLLQLLLAGQLSPRAADAVETAAPPIVEIVVMAPLDFGRLVHHGAQSTEEVSIDETTRLLPLEILIVERLVLTEQVEVIGQFFGAVEVIHVDERVLRRVFLVVDARSSHHDGYHIGSTNNMRIETLHQNSTHQCQISKDVPQSVDVELLGDVIAAVGVLEGQIELVVLG